jgi:hypothetical protein
MNTVGVETALKAKVPVQMIVNKFVSGADYMTFAALIKNDPYQVEEFLKMFLHKKKLPAAIKWNTLVTLNKKERAFDLVTFDETGHPIYEDSSFTIYVIKHSLNLIGIPATHDFITRSIQETYGHDCKFNPYICCMYIMKDHVPDFNKFIYSEFAADYYEPKVLLQAMAILEEDSEGDTVNV